MSFAASVKILIRKNKKCSEKRGAYRKCCLVWCNNSERNNRDLHFYRFPSRPCEAVRKMIWLLAAGRGSEINPDKDWRPIESSRVCSAHFEGGKKSNDPRKTSYNPTIFPKIHGKQKSDQARCKRLNAQNQEELAPLKINTYFLVNKVLQIL